MHDLTPRQKRKARIAALQVMYAHEFHGSDIDTTIKYMLDPDNSQKVTILDYSRHLCILVIEHQNETDKLIMEWSKNWDINRITIMDRLILRMSLAEMIHEDQVPPKVSITEGVEIAKEFSTADSSSFINGILDAVYNDLVKAKEKTV